MFALESWLMHQPPCRVPAQPRSQSGRAVKTMCALLKMESRLMKRNKKGGARKVLLVSLSLSVSVQRSAIDSTNELT
jgi:hypothetical protein